MTDSAAGDRSRPSLPKRNKYGQRRRCRSLCTAVNQSCFGEKIIVSRCDDDRFSSIRVVDPLGTKIGWSEPPQSVLLLRKNDDTLVNSFIDILSFLIEKNLLVYIEATDSVGNALPKGDKRWERIRKISHKDAVDGDFSDEVDFVICIGGDGTLIRAASFFPRSCPPVMPFNSGSFGFLNPFDAGRYKESIQKVLAGDVPVLIRERLECKVTKSSDHTVLHSALALNEIVIDRGSHAFITNIDMFLNNKFITKVQGDGLIISTPTGSTAYAMAAGASMVHPNVDAIIICPICPHSLSFRPIIVPQKVKLKLVVSDMARNTGALSIDGRFICQVKPHNSVEITTSFNPVPCICARDQIADWFESLAHCLHWNVRVAQKPLHRRSPDSETTSEGPNEEDEGL